MFNLYLNFFFLKGRETPFIKSYFTRWIWTNQNGLNNPLKFEWIEQILFSWDYLSFLHSYSSYLVYSLFSFILKIINKFLILSFHITYLRFIKFFEDGDLSIM